MNLITLIILLTGCSTKAVLMIICFKRGTASSKVENTMKDWGEERILKVLAMDMRNDIATSTVAIIAAFVGDRYWKYADPIGACIVWYDISHSNYIISLNVSPVDDAFQWNNRIELVPSCTGTHSFSNGSKRRKGTSIQDIEDCYWTWWENTVSKDEIEEEEGDERVRLFIDRRERVVLILCPSLQSRLVQS